VRPLLRILTLLGILTVSVPAAASADWQIAPFLGLTFQGDTSINDPEGGAGNVHWHIGGAVTLLGAGPFGVEGLAVYTPGFFETDEPTPLATNSRSFALMGNFVLATPRSWNEYGLRPYVSGGMGLLHGSYNYPVEELQGVRANLLGYNVGGGAIGFLTDRAGLRFDLRYFGTLNPRETQPGDVAISFGPVRISYWTAGVGVVFKY
jgi:hypothetical protein